MRALQIAAALAFVAALALGCGQGALTGPEELDVPAPLFQQNCDGECAGDQDDQDSDGEQDDQD